METNKTELTRERELLQETAPEAEAPREIAVPEPPKKQGRGGFGAGLVIYAWILLALSGLVLGVFYLWLGDYENSGVELCVEEHLQSLHSQAPEAAARALSELDPAIRSPEDNLRWAEGLLAECTLQGLPAQSTEQRRVYAVKASDGQVIGTATFAVTGAGNYNLPVWELVDEHFDFCSYYRLAEIVVPEGYSVYFGEKLLGQDEVVEDDIPYAALEACYQHYEDLPHMLRYVYGPFVELPELRVLDDKGREQPLEILNEDFFLDNCEGEIRGEIEDFVPSFVELYAFYSADVNGTALHYYTRLFHLTVPDSPLRNAINGAIDSFGWSNTKALRIESIEINRITDLGQGRYLADVSYDSLVTGLKGEVPTHDDVQIVLIETNGKLLADALFFS